MEVEIDVGHFGLILPDRPTTGWAETHNIIAGRSAHEDTMGRQ